MIIIAYTISFFFPDLKWGYWFFWRQKGFNSVREAMAEVFFNLLPARVIGCSSVPDFHD